MHVSDILVLSTPPLSELDKGRESATPEVDDDAVYATITSFTAISRPEAARVTSSPREHRRTVSSLGNGTPPPESMSRPSSISNTRRARRVVPWYRRLRRAIGRILKGVCCCGAAGAADSEERVRVRIRRDSRGRTVIKTRLIGMEGEEDDDEEEAIVEDDEIEWGLSSGPYERQRMNGGKVLNGPSGLGPDDDLVKVKDKDAEELAEMDHVMIIFANALQMIPLELSQRYLFRGLLGYGGNGFVGEAVNRKDGTPVAVKFISRQRIGKDSLITSDAYPYPVPLEAEILRIVEHKNITRFYALYTDDIFYMIVMERAAPLTWRLGDDPGKETDRSSLNRPGAHTPQRRTTRVDTTSQEPATPPPTDAPTPWAQSLPSVASNTTRPRSGRPTHPGRMPSDSSLLSTDSRQRPVEPFVFPTGTRDLSASTKAGSWTRDPSTSAKAGSWTRPLSSDKTTLPNSPGTYSILNKRNSGMSQNLHPEPPASARHSMFGADQPPLTSLTRPRHCHAGDLYDFLTMYGRTPLNVQRHLFRQLVEAALALKQAGFVYLDFRGENVMVDDSLHIKLVDFGMSQPMLPPPPTPRPESVGGSSSVKQQTYEVFEQYGTREASAPEILLGKGYRGPEADVWALGLILYLIATGGEEAFKSEAAAVGGAVAYPAFMDSDCKDLIARMLTVNAERRATLEEILHHSWLTSTEE
ncbi:hypothetical protein HDV00_007851 [Rhizophlyctis rosea]|nr:hypothetical protein HDV00_007851 [Rhizophlyctis rosea]